MINLLKIESKRESWIEEASQIYEIKISKLVHFKVTPLKGTKLERSDSSFKKIADSDLLLKNINAADFNILFDERGKKIDSIGFSKIFLNFQNSGKKHCNLLIGGPYGTTDELRIKATVVLSLSDLTFNHWIAELVVLEQVYRAFSIIKNLPYHNE